MEKGLSVENLKAYYFANNNVIKAVDDVSFTLNEGESFGIAGESACGKSTLGLCIMRMLQSPGKIVDGKIIMNGIDILAMSDKEFTKNTRWKRISMIFQGAMNALDPVYSIKDQLKEVLTQHGFPQKNIDTRIREVIKQVGLNPSVVNRYPHELSGGMKQRIVIAMALLLEPEFVIADEPTTALDVLVQAQIINLLKKLKKKGMSIMLITHDLAIISEIADNIGVMYAGKMIEFGSVEQIYNDPKHPYTQALIAAIPRLKDRKKISYIKGSPPNLANPPKGCRFYDRCLHTMDICKHDPPLIKIKDAYVRCWLYED
ncbi:MAG: dipeptide/oligopeptide/nickel ABC transporter ATP-binding protein [Thaumarchaeota archaeon]|nr:dipeptide/oligopeptide/nickel ABC transporter ATP-binding protein [Nitrososphaerota archaeon]